MNGADEYLRDDRSFQEVKRVRERGGGLRDFASATKRGFYPLNEKPPGILVDFYLCHEIDT